MKKFWVLKFDSGIFKENEIAIAHGHICDILVALGGRCVRFIVDIHEQEFIDARDLLGIMDISDLIKDSNPTEKEV